MTFDKEKFKRLVHYIAWKAGKHDGFGATKLNKVLWFADARTYALTGKPITGATYIREKYGPVPQQMMPMQRELEHEGAIEVIKRRGDFERTQFRAEFKPDMSIFSALEVQTVDYWIDHIDKQHTAKSISEVTHEDYAWQIAKEGEEIPLYAIRLSRIDESTDEELERLRQRAKEIGLN